MTVLLKDLRFCVVASAGVLVPGSASAGWGDENWGEMVWGGAVVAPLPSLSVEGLLALTGLFLLSACTLLALRRRRSRFPEPAGPPFPNTPREESVMNDMDLQQLRELRRQVEGLRSELVELQRRPGLRARAAITRVASSRSAWVVAMTAVLVFAAASYAATISIPYTFSNGTIADANEVNTNFGAIVSESNAQHSRLSALEAAVLSIQGQVSTNAADITSLEGDIATVQVALSANTLDIAANQSNIAANASAIAVNSAEIGSNATDIATNTSDLDVLEVTFTGASRAGDLLTFSAMNVQLVDGSGNTFGAVNGLGNLIVGYNENLSGATRTGSHNLVVGLNHEYTSYGGLVAGEGNTISGVAASVTGGISNEATADYASVSGGTSNEASDFYASVSGGQQNHASSTASSVSGGGNNTAASDQASVSGGILNTASGGAAPSVCGGRNNMATGSQAVVGGGHSNAASGNYSSVSGGLSNTASGHYASVSAGESNVAQGNRSSVSGGQTNQANEVWSTVSGGNLRTVTGSHDWRAGTLFEDN